MGPVGQPLGTKTCDILIIFDPWYCLLFITSVEVFDWLLRSRKNAKRTHMIEDSNHWPPPLSSRLKSYSTNAPTWSLRTNNPDNVKIYFYSRYHPLNISAADGSRWSASRYNIMIIFYQYLTFYGRGTLQDVGPICHTHILRCSYWKIQKLKYLAHGNYNVNGRLQPKTEIFGPTGNVVQYFFLLGRWYMGLPKKKNYMGCRWWVPEVSLSVQENLRKIQKRMLERRFEHKTSLSLKHESNGALPLHQYQDCL